MIRPIIQDLMPGKVHSGKQLKRLLGLDDFNYVWVRKILNVSIPIYIIVYNSRFPDLYLPIKKILTLKAFSMYRTKKIVGQELQKFIISLPTLLENYNKKILSGSIIISYDIAGEYFQTKD